MNPNAFIIHEKKNPTYFQNKCGLLEKCVLVDFTIVVVYAHILLEGHLFDEGQQGRGDVVRVQLGRGGDTELRLRIG